MLLNNEKKKIFYFNVDYRKKDQKNYSKVVLKNFVTIDDYNEDKCFYRYSLVKLSIKDFYELFVQFCISYKHNDWKKETVWTFVRKVIKFLHYKGLTLDQTTLRQVDTIIEINKTEYMKEFKQQLIKENSETISVGIYQKDDYDVGLFIKINTKNQWAVEFGDYGGNYKFSNILVRMQSNENFRHKPVVKELSKQNAIEFVEFCMSCGQNLKTSNNSFVLDAIEFLHNNEMITEEKKTEVSDKLLRIMSDVPEYINKLKEEMLSENCEVMVLGWYRRDDLTDQVGLVILMNRKVKFTLDLIVSEDNSVHFPKIVARKIESYDTPTFCVMSTLAKFNKSELIKFLESYKFAEDSQTEGHNCRDNHNIQNSWNFVHGVIEFLHRKSMITREEEKTFLSQLKKLTVDEPKFIKEVKKEMRKENCESAEIGCYKYKFSNI